jgi:hypothetical protein
VIRGASRSRCACRTTSFAPATRRRSAGCSTRIDKLLVSDQRVDWSKLTTLLRATKSNSLASISAAYLSVSRPSVESCLATTSSRLNSNDRFVCAFWLGLHRATSTVEGLPQGLAAAPALEPATYPEELGFATDPAARIFHIGETAAGQTSARVLIDGRDDLPLPEHFHEFAYDPQSAGYRCPCREFLSPLEDDAFE